MRPHILWTIFCKELRDALRDRLTLAVVILLPMLLYPLMITGLGKIQSVQAASQEEKASRIAVWGTLSDAQIKQLKGTNNVIFEHWIGARKAIRNGLESGQLQPPPSDETNAPVKGVAKSARSVKEAPVENEVLQAAREVVTLRKVEAVLILWPGFKEALADEGLGKVAVYYDSVLPTSQKASDRLNQALWDFRRALLVERERTHGLKEGFITGVDIRWFNVAPAKRRAASALGALLPFVLIMLSASGSLTAALDLTAGEKDRATMQTLLCAPVHSLEIVGGKFLAIWTVSLLAALANLVSLVATMSRVSSQIDLTGMSPLTCLLAFIMLLPATFMISALFLAVATLARDVKDAGNFLGATLSLLLMPMMATLLPGVELNAWTAFVPLVNLSLLIKAIFLAEAKPEVMFLALASSLTYATLAILLAARVFGQEQILLGGRGSLASLFRRNRDGAALPGPSVSLTLFAATLVLVFYGSLLLEKAGIVTTVLVTEYGFYLLPVALLAWWMRYPERTTFSLGKPSLRGLAGAGLIGLSAWAIIAGLAFRLLPPPDSLVEALKKVVLLEDANSPLWAAWLVVAATPAICEELFFRGLVFAGLRRFGTWPALLISSLLFALAHASIYRLLPTFLLGLLLGFVLIRTGSIFCCMLLHLLNNGLAVTLARHPALAEKMGFQDSAPVPWTITLIGFALVLAGLWLLPKSEKRPVISEQSSVNSHQ
ncbi:MAG: ABC transporter permease subunit/CPBP intramembrane protease [Verrucomicrobiota bacterium]